MTVRQARGSLPGVRLVRDRLTVSLYTTFITFGWFLYGFSPAVPLIAVEQGITRAQAGLHGTAMAAGAILAGLVSAAVAARLGRRVQTALGHGVLVLGVLGLLVGTSLPATLLACLVAAAGGNLAIAAAQPALSLHHGAGGPAAVTEGNGIGAAVGLLAPLAVGASVALGWGWRPAVGLAIVIAVTAATLVLRQPDAGALGGRVARPPVGVGATVPDAAGATEKETEATATGHDRARGPGSAERRRFSGTFWFFWTAMLCGVAIEFATAFWAADLLRVRSEAPDHVATAAVSALVAGMATARFVVGPLSLRKAPEKLLLVAYTVAGIGFAVFWTATAPAIAMAGLVVAGLGYGAHYPLAIALALRASEGRPDQAQARATVGAGVAIALAPFALGALADRFGSHAGFLLVPVLIVAGGTAVALGLRSVRRGLRTTAPRPA